MHEVAIVQDIVNKVLVAIDSYKVVKVESVSVEVGELTMLSPDQMKFAFDALIKDNVLKGSKLLILKREAVIKCHKCGYTGKPGYWDDSNHMSIPTISCPTCNGTEMSVVKGRECVLKDIRVEVMD